MNLLVLSSVLLLSSLCCNVFTGKKHTTLENPTPGQDTVYCMDFANRQSVELPLSPLSEQLTRKSLIKVEISKVTNPDKYPIRIGVWVETPNETTQIKVGNFSLFPVDNPGNYIFDLNQYGNLPSNLDRLIVRLSLIYEAVGVDNSKVEICVKPLQIE